MDAGCHGARGTAPLKGTSFCDSQRDKETKAGTPESSQACPRPVPLCVPHSLTWFRANATAKQDALLERISPLIRASSLNVVQI